jgi:hypothetical protein
MKRREFLVTGATLSIAASGGCTGCAPAPKANLDMVETDDLGIARKVTFYEDGPIEDFYANVVETGTAVVNDTEVPYPANRSFVYEDAIYQLSYDITESRPAQVFPFTLNPAEGAVDESAVIRFEDLPNVDRQKLASRGLDEDPFLGFGSTLLYYEPEVSQSALVPEPDYPVIEWDDETRGRFTVDGSYDETVDTYRYAVEQVHPSAARFGRSIRERHEFRLFGLSDGERTIITEAIENERGWVLMPNESPPDALYSLIDRFSRREEVLREWEDENDRTEGPSGNYIVRYDGTVYWTRFGVDLNALTESGQ